jgi:hypothetical protein
MTKILFYCSIVVLILIVSTDKTTAATNIFQTAQKIENPPVEGKKPKIKNKATQSNELITLNNNEKKPHGKFFVPRWYLLAGALLCILLGIIIKAVLPITANFTIVWIFETVGLVSLFAWVILWVRDIGMRYGDTHPTHIHRRVRRGRYKR